MAKRNILTLQGGKYGDNVYGGYAFAARNTATAGGNIVTLQGDDVSGGVLLPLTLRTQLSGEAARLLEDRSTRRVRQIP